MLIRKEIQQFLKSLELSQDFVWYCDELDNRSFIVRGSDGGVSTTWMLILFYRPNFTEPPFDPFDGFLGRSGLHKNGNNSWYVLEFNFSKGISELKELIKFAINELSLSYVPR